MYGGDVSLVSLSITRGYLMVRLRRRLSEEHKFIFSFIRNLQILLVFGSIMATLVLLEARVLGHVGDDIFPMLKFAFLVVFSLELILTIAYQVCSYFWKQEVFGMYIGKYYTVEEKKEVEEDGKS